uniref:xanthine dehydrogenase/oxidase-like isoform X2 n=1 Tax=Styela clava TaxID=7725 RepID=UPI001939CE17|nr:xanthine dehydrogenase/oxidase-like isoform X2 [Styela clava]
MSTLLLFYYLTEHDGVKWDLYDDSQEPIFPPELMMSGKLNSDTPRSLKFVGNNVTWHQPTSLRESLTIKKQHPEARIVVGNTEVGIEMHIKGRTYTHLISPVNVKELNNMMESDEGVSIGAACSLTDVEQFLKAIIEKRNEKQCQACGSVLEMLELFAGSQIRNVACIGGNIMTASPISDLNPILLAVGAKLTFASSSSGLREIQMDETFFTGYRRTNTKSDEILVSVTIPFLDENDIMKAYKQSRRKEDDIAIVNAGMYVAFQPGTAVVKKLSMAYGGMSAVTKIPIQTMSKASGRKWDKSLLEDICCWLSEEMKLPLDAPGGMIQYRRTLVTCFFFKFFHHVGKSLIDREIQQVEKTKTDLDVLQPMSTETESFTATQTWQETYTEQPNYDTIGKSRMHVSGIKHTTGEAVYIDDIPLHQGEVHLALVCSTRAHARITSVDSNLALKSLGVVDYIDRGDVIGENDMHEFGEVFADGKVTCIGHVIGAVAADTQAHAIKASSLVKVTYEDIQPKIITIEEAISHNSFYESSTRLVKGNVDDGFRLCDKIIESDLRVGGQEHFYLETQACIAIPKGEDGEMEVLSSCQDMNELQKMAAMCLGVDRNKVTVRTKRLGGGFGGKQSRFHVVSNPAVTAARKLGRPVRCILTRQQDMQITGGRHPYLGRYKVGFTNEGSIMALRVELYSNGGNTADLSFEIMLRATTHADNCYNIPHMEVIGRICKTNIASNTAFRGFGAPQSMIIVEDWITRVADTLNKSPEEIRELNMYKNGDKILHGLVLENFQAKRCWDECMEKSNFIEARRAAEEYNKNNRWKKRGIACVPSKYSVGYGVTFLEQGGALVLIYSDGTVLLSHGGVEMGQGLHTKMMQVASRELGIPMKFIHISESTTASVPNTSPSAASMSSDLNGMAVKNACEKLLKRLEPLRKRNPNLVWSRLIEKAYMERISLAATGFYRSPGIDVEWNQKTGVITGNMFNYLAYGTAVSQVEIDVLTGHHAVLRTDIVIDVGNSINPAIDIGQIEGAFTQGYGMMTLEEKLHSPSGHLWHTGPGSYKIPGFSDTPKKFNVHFLRSCPNEKAIYCSKVSCG